MQSHKNSCQYKIWRLKQILKRKPILNKTEKEDLERKSQPQIKKFHNLKKERERERERERDNRWWIMNSTPGYILTKGYN